MWQVHVEKELAKLGPTLELKQIGQLAATIKKLRRDLGKSHAFRSMAFGGAVVSAERTYWPRLVNPVPDLLQYFATRREGVLAVGPGRRRHFTS